MCRELSEELDASMAMLAESLPATATAPRARPSFAFLVGSLAGGNIVNFCLRLIGGVLQARFVSPSVLGLFNGIGLVLGYVPFLQLGILNGLNRVISLHIKLKKRLHRYLSCSCPSVHNLSPLFTFQKYVLSNI